MTHTTPASLPPPARPPIPLSAAVGWTQLTMPTPEGSEDCRIWVRKSAVVAVYDSPTHHHTNVLLTGDGAPIKVRETVPEVICALAP